MDKKTLLSSIKLLASQNLISQEEVISAFEDGKGSRTNSLKKRLGISEVLYFIGGFIVFLGVAILIGQNWDALNSFTKILTTLGFGIAAYFAGVILTRDTKHGAVGYAFHLIAALIIPLGIGVVLDLAGYDTVSAGSQSLIGGILFATYMSSYFVFKKPLFTFFSIAYATWFFFSFTNFLIGPNPYFYDMKFYEYRFLLVGLSYMLFGYYFSSTQQKDLTGPLYSFGSLFFLSAAMVLGGWNPSQNIFWEALFPGLVFAVLLLSVRLKSQSFLTFGTIFLMIYILKITGEYFSGTLGWPLSLMICGIALIGIGYYAFTLNKKYLSTSKKPI